MLGFVKQIFVLAMMFFRCNVSSVNPLKRVSLSNQECRIRPEIINTNSNEPSCYPYSVKINKCSGNFNNIKNSYTKLCVLMLLKI